MTTKLLMLTKHFPYNLGETAAESYLETEIGYMADAFDEVAIVATEAPSGRPLVQRIPSNVHALPLGNVQTKSEKAKCLASGMTSRDARARYAIRLEPELTPTQRTFQRYFVGKALRKWKRLARYLRQEGFAPTHIYSFWFHDTSLMAIWTRESYPCARVVARAHRYDLYRDRTHALYLPCRELLMRELDAILPCSQDGSQYLRNWFPQFSDKIRTAYLGTRELPDMSDEPRGTIFKVISCSRVVPVKRLGLLCDAISLLDAEGASIAWTHYGDGPDLPEIRRRTDSFRTVATTFPGNIPNKKLLDFYAKNHADLFVNVSSSEGLPVSIMEASGHGVPVIATDVGGTREIVSNGEGGLIISENIKADELAAAISRFIAMSANEYSSFRKVARRNWEQRFRTKDNVGILLNALQKEVG